MSYHPISSTAWIRLQRVSTGEVTQLTAARVKRVAMTRAESRAVGMLGRGRVQTHSLGQLLSYARHSKEDGRRVPLLDTQPCKSACGRPQMMRHERHVSSECRWACAINLGLGLIRHSKALRLTL